MTFGLVCRNLSEEEWTKRTWWLQLQLQTEEAAAEEALTAAAEAELERDCNKSAKKKPQKKQWLSCALKTKGQKLGNHGTSEKKALIH